MGRSRKQDIIFACSSACAQGRGYLRRRRAGDSAGRLRLPALLDSSYLAGPDDIYVSPSQIRRFNLRTAIHIRIDPTAQDGNRALLALLKSGQINYDSPRARAAKVLFENLTPAHPTERLKLERATDRRRLDARAIDGGADRQGQRGLIVSPPKAGKTMR